jgi:hypothetical protein
MNEKRDDIYPDEDLSMYANNVVADENVKNIQLTIQQEKQSISVDVFNRFSSVLGHVKIERF